MTPPAGERPLADLHARSDERGIPLPEVGVRGVAARLSIEDSRDAHPAGPVRLSLSVALPAHQRGAHLSRFGEAIAAWDGRLRIAELPDLCRELAARFEAPFARLEGAFPLHVLRRAPISGSAGLIELAAGFSAEQPAKGGPIRQRLTALVQTLCPCSKAISAQGAHNQRCQVTVEADSLAGLPYLDLQLAIEGAGSCAVYPVLKRPDEKHVTEHAYAHPAFVEDVARELARELGRSSTVLGYRVEAVSQESIHPHDAFAVAEQLARTQDCD